MPMIHYALQRFGFVLDSEGDTLGAERLVEESLAIDSHLSCRRCPCSTWTVGWRLGQRSAARPPPLAPAATIRNRSHPCPRSLAPPARVTSLCRAPAWPRAKCARGCSRPT